MSIVQKLKVDLELTSNLQVIARDETGLYNPSNTGGYGGPNGNPLSKFEKYIFDLTNLYTNTKYRQIQSDDLDNTDEKHNPSLARIVNKENINITSNNFEILKFEDSLYRLYMYLQFTDSYAGNGDIDEEVVTDVEEGSILYNDYHGIIVDDEIYLITGLVGTTLILDRPIVTAFSSFKPILKTSFDFIISDTLNDCINSSIAKLAKNCNCSNNIADINTLSEIELYYWGIARCIETNDIPQAYEYLKMAKDLCTSMNCRCNG